MDDTLGSRLKTALGRRKIKPAVAARAAHTTEATVSNWINDKVQIEQIKAMLLFQIADVAQVDPRELLFGKREADKVRERHAEYQSHPLKHDVHIVAIQLVLEALQSRNLTLPPVKQAEAISLAYDLLDEGLPQAKVLRFVLAAVA